MRGYGYLRSRTRRWARGRGKTWNSRSVARRMARGVRWALCFALLAGGAGGGLMPGVARASTPGITWLIDAHALTLLKNAGASSSLLNEAFGGSRTYVPGRPAPGSLGMPTATYYSYAAIKTAFSNGTLPGPYHAVLLDMEHWRYTPTSEQKSPATYEKLSAQLVHGHTVDGRKMLFITAPAVDLVRARCTCSSGSSARQQYLTWDIAGGAARYADAFDIQGQNDERDISSYESFVGKAAGQARAANSHVAVLAGLSTDNGPQEVYGYQLINAYQAVRGKVAGYWLNIPGPSNQCPSCGGPYPGPALTLLRKIYG
jgi:hypothetical protein